MYKYERTLLLAMPKGELERPAFDALRKIGYVIPEPNGKEYITQVENAPIILFRGRASDIPKNVFEKDSDVVAGITGSDILWEEGYNRGRIGSEVPVELFFAGVKRPDIYLGVTEEFSDNIKKQTGRTVIPQDLSGKILFSKYANIAKDFMQDNGVYDVDIRRRGGSIEGMRYAYKDSVALVDIWVSGRTAMDNCIIKAATITPVITTLFEDTTKASAFEQRVVDDIRDKIFIEKQRMQSLSTAFA